MKRIFLLTAMFIVLAATSFSTISQVNVSQANTSKITTSKVATSSKAATAAKATVLITGANRGIGLALAEKFHQQGFHVIATARKPQKADKLKKLGVQIEQLDIIDPKSIAALKHRLGNMPIDILINNAGIGGHSTRKFSDLNVERLMRVLNVNSLGALRVIQAMLPNLEKSNKKIIASVSSKMGSIELNTSGGVLGYRASKTALNSFNKSLSIEYADRGYVFVVLHPGWVRTDMTSDRATYSTQESAAGLFKVISNLKREDNGRFFDLHGKALSW
ncbi:SDR family oxidoreductase [Aliikangiella coralliicola]|uniref:SDR family oxidoreductase n=1 Tax=Aliikangiella coralliicola TaxID=2592383 RepID=A0A545UES9_9GAMM|nr:SDR family oxidoreductase [Aliikangiella coralliicola]TQV87945.1 SDR family oxidoreductase [Aliikangiella coralliicola]